MTEAKVFQYQSPLARKMAVPGGKSIDAALNAAEGALETHREAVMHALELILADLEAACARRAGEAIYERAAALLDMAGFFDLGHLHPAMFSLCEISSHMADGGWDWPSVEVHLRAIRMILANGCRQTDDATLLLEGLASIRERVMRHAVRT